VGLYAAAPPLAGLSGTSRFRFLAFDAVGAALWAGAYAGLGYVFSKDLDRAASYVASLGKVFAVFVLAGVTIYFGRKLVRRFRARISKGGDSGNVESETRGRWKDYDYGF
jgi:membrane protein DedA with SNARE-associated domain